MACFQFAQSRFQRPHGREDGLRLLQDGVFGVDRRFLAQIAQPPPGARRRETLATSSGSSWPEQDPQQGGLAAAVAPDQAHLLPGGDAEGDFAEQQVRAVTFF